MYCCCWSSPVQSCSGLSPTGLKIKFYCPNSWDSPKLEGQVPIFISPRNRVAQIYPPGTGLGRFINYAEYLYSQYNLKLNLHHCTANQRGRPTWENKKVIVTQRNVTAGHPLQKGRDTKTNWLTDCRSQYNLNLNFSPSHNFFCDYDKSKLYYDWQAVVQSVLVSGTHLGPTTNFSFSLKFSLDSCGFVVPSLTRGTGL
jgi:hypothetical protein